MPKDYSNLDKEELLKIIEKLEARKKYGLIWDEEKVKEQFEKDAENALPILKEVRSKEIIDRNPVPNHILIEGDNYHALSVLNFTHQGKIDLIYIDPPYNTGNKSWKYNNDYVEKEDSYRHSKWISFMNKRLRLAKNLLKGEGTLMCAIDENEQAQLGLLLEEIFPYPTYEIHCIVIIHNPGGVQGKNFSYSHEYVYFVIPGGKTAIGLQNREDNPDIRPLRDVSTGNHLRVDAKNCFYPICVKNGKIIGFGDVCPDSFHPKTANIERKDGVLEIYPIDAQGNERKWVFARQTVESIKDDLTVEYNRQRKIWDVIRKKTRFNYKTVWDDKHFNANIYGTKLLSQIIDIKFPFPKSMYAVKECIHAVIHSKDAIILDFFAGSGTTAHAVLDLNKDDGGQRSFILSTNNEGGICEEITYPRVKNIITGYKNRISGKPVEGYGGNLKYFKTKFVKMSAAKDELKIRLANECTEMLCLREGVFDELKSTSDYKIFKQNNKTLAIYYSLDRDALKGLKKELNKLEGAKTLYCFTLDPLGLSKSDFVGWNDVVLEPIPQKILDVYKQIYEY